MENFDVVIIGGGPVGLAAAIEAKRLDLNYIVLEKGILVNSIFHFPVNMQFFTTAALLEIGNHPFPSTALKPGRQMTLDYYRRVVELEKLNILLNHELLTMTKSDENPIEYSLEIINRFRGEEIKKRFLTKFVVIATGYFDNPNGLGGIPGDTGPNVSYYYSDPHPYYDQDIIIVGGGNSGAEAALEIYRHGARVTLVHKHPKLQTTLKYWVSPDLENRIKNGEIKAIMPAEVLEITLKGMKVSFQNEDIFIPADHIIVLTGFHPNIELFAKWGLIANPDTLSIKLNESFETELSNIYMIGSAGFGRKTNQVFIENGRDHAKIAITDIKLKLQ